MTVYKVETLEDLSRAVAAAIGKDQFNFILTVFDKSGSGAFHLFSSANDAEILAHLKSIIAEKEGRLFSCHREIN